MKDNKAIGIPIIPKELVKGLMNLGHTNKWRRIAEIDKELHAILGDTYEAFFCEERPGIGFRAEWFLEGSKFSTLQGTRLKAMEIALKAAQPFKN